MGLLDYLNQDDGSSQMGGQGMLVPGSSAPAAPTPGAPPGLLDRLGTAFSGQAPINLQLAQQLGLDPRALQHQTAMAALGRMAQGFLQSGATNQNFGAAVGAGLGAASSGPNPADQAIQQAAAGQKIAYEAQKTAHDKAVQDRADAYSTGIANGTVWLPSELEGLRAAFANEPGMLGKSMIDFYNNAQKDKHDAAAATLAAQRDDARANGQNATALAVASRQASAQLAAAGLPAAKDQQLAQMLVDNPAGTPMGDALRSVKGIIAPAVNDPSAKADATATAKRGADISTQLDKIDANRDSITNMLNGFQTGTYNTGNSAQQQYNSMAPRALRSDATNELDAGTNSLVLSTLASLKNTRGSNMISGIVQKSKIGVDQGDVANIAILNHMLSATDVGRAQLAAEAQHYGKGGTLSSWNALRGASGGPGGAPNPDGSAAGGFVNGHTYKDANGNQAVYNNGQWTPTGQ